MFRLNGLQIQYNLTHIHYPDRAWVQELHRQQVCDTLYQLGQTTEKSFHHWLTYRPTTEKNDEMGFGK